MKKGLNGSVLKLIAVFTMLIDHIAAAWLLRAMYAGPTVLDNALVTWLFRTGHIMEIYNGMRTIGRIAFPIYCFLLVEGFEHTKNWKKYAQRLGLFALISEIPFDLAFHSTYLNMEYQNVFFTLLIGLLTIVIYHRVEMQESVNYLARYVLQMGVLLVGMGVAELLGTDYGAKGILCIMVLYIFREKRIYQVVAGCFSFCWWELPAVIAFVPIALYNGERGWKLKYFFYLFYPLHLLLIYIVCVAMGMA